MTDKQEPDESSTGHHADAHGSTPLDDAAVEQVSGGWAVKPQSLGGVACTNAAGCPASNHVAACPANVS